MLRDNRVGLIELIFTARELDLSRCALNRNQYRTIDPQCLENPRPKGGISTLTENVSSPFHAEPGQNSFMNFRGLAHRPLQHTLPFLIVLLFCIISSCRKPSSAPVTVNFLHAWWLHPDELLRVEREFQEFSSETGIAVQQPPVPETLFSSLQPLAQLDLLRRVLQEGGPSPDVLGIDVIWPGTLADHLIDLRPDFGTELSSQDPRLVSSYTVHGKVVAVPYRTHVAVLEYRTDLLRQYGYRHPPETWDELESMAARIQAGERAKGRKNFWGYIWPGAATEGLTCNALEWQVAEGGGRLIEDDETISVNNPAAIRSWQRAAGWIGWISPPGVLAYQDTDSLNVWDSGNAAFRRSWEWGYSLSHPGE